MFKLFIFCYSEGKKSQKWFSKFISRKSTSAPQVGMPQSKSWDSLSTKTRSKDHLDKDSIPTPPPVPSPRFLLGNIPMSKKSSGMNLKEELLSSRGREAYDEDGDEEGSDEEVRQAARRIGNRLARSKMNAKQLSKKKRSTKVEDLRGIKGSAMLEGYKASSPRVRKKLGEQRQLTPYPSNAPVYNIKSDLSTPKTLDFDSDDPVSPPPPSSPVQQAKSQPRRQAAPAVLKPVRPAPQPPRTSSAPIAKAVSTRSKRPLAPKSPPQQPVANRHSQSNGTNTAPIAKPLLEALNKQQGNSGNLAPRQFASQHFVLRKQTSTVEKAEEKEEEEESDSTDSFTDSSEEEETETSETDGSSDEDAESMVKATHVEAPSHLSIPMRPISAKNKALFGARAARQAMMRMKAARYPRILRKQIIKLDTIDENKFEKIHQTVRETQF